MSRYGRRRSSVAAGGAVGPDPASLAEERLVEIMDKVVRSCLEDPPPKDGGAPACVMQALCLMHPRYKEHAEFVRLQGEEVRLQEKLKRLEKQRDEAPLRRRSSNLSQLSKKSSNLDPSSLSALDEGDEDDQDL
mmetsp:Transcript_140791/g.392441  ORF Transcript_140791/g.392441 Transcript_140791/m.392441 type:complete len:134 (+) Transcript_140791:107-508(+)